MPEANLKTSEEILIEFLEEHQNEIKGLFKDIYYKDIALTAMISASIEVEKKYQIKYNVDEIKNYHKIILQYLF